MKKLLSTILVGAMLALPSMAQAQQCNLNTDIPVNVNNLLSKASLSDDCVISDLMNEKVSEWISGFKANTETNDFWKDIAANINNGKLSTGWTDIIAQPTNPALPECETPECFAPECEIPEIQVPEVQVPEIPKPEIPTPEMPTPEIPAPEVPKPETPAPEIPSQGSHSAYINEVIRLVNQERTSRGLSALSADATLMNAAQKRAEEIVRLFSHTRPNGTSTFTILDEFGANYRGAGENIAMGQRTPADVMNGWMNSEGHRANILKSSFTHIGVGCYESGGRLYWTQFFTY